VIEWRYGDQLDWRLALIGLRLSERGCERGLDAPLPDLRFVHPEVVSDPHVRPTGEREF